MSPEVAPPMVPATGGTGCDVSGQKRVSSSTNGHDAPQLRPYQVAAVDRIEADPHRRSLMVAPTGSGKTVIAVELIRRARARGERILFVDHRREITAQTCRKLWDFRIDHGTVQSGFPPRPGEPVQVASIQTVHARAIRGSTSYLPAADLIVIDEAHHARAATYQRLIAAYPSARILGLTATPCRGDGRGLGNIFESLIEVATVGGLIAAGWLVPTQVYAPIRPDLTGVAVRRGDYAENQLAARVNTDRLVGDIVEYWFKLAERRKTVIFATGVAHSVHLRDEFRRAGVLAEHVDGSTPTEERDTMLERLAGGDIEIVTNCQVLTEGWDCPEVSCIVLARPTKSLELFRQMVGRVLRPAPGKTNALVLDHAGAVFEHGLVDDPINWTLGEDDRAENLAHRARGEYEPPALTTCPECSAVRFEGQPCWVCSWHPVAKPKIVDVAEGELGAVNRNRSVQNVNSDDPVDFYRMLLYIAEEKGRNPGWAWHKIKEKFGIELRGRFRSIPPSDAVRAWARSRDIAFAREMAKQRGAP